MTDLASLIARLEAAEGPSRELDAEIMFDAFAQPVGKSEVDGGPIGYIWPEDNPSWNLGIRFPGKDRAWLAETRRRIEGETLSIQRDGALVLMNSQRVLPFTASLDAALRLVPKELYWVLGAGKVTPDEPLYGAVVQDPMTRREIGAGESNANAALALTAAALTARTREARRRLMRGTV